jgi:hypothetical protein
MLGFGAFLDTRRTALQLRIQNQNIPVIRDRNTRLGKR